MSIATERDLEQYCRETARKARAASAELAVLSGQQKNAWLKDSARRLRQGMAAVLTANGDDIAAAPRYGLT